MDLGLAGRHCFVTDASAGIGRGAALALAAEGALLSIAGRDEGALLATRDMIVAQGASVLRIIACDLSQPAGIETAAAAIARAERPVEVLINNALYRQGSRPTGDRGLGRSRGVHPLERKRAGDRDDPPPTRTAHGGQGALGETACCGEVEPNRLVPRFRVQLRIEIVGAATAADFAVIKDWGTKTQSIDTARMLSFEPISFQWQAMRLRVPLPETTRWQPMQHWFWRWFKEDAGDHNEAFTGAVHFLSDPEVSDDGVTFAVDLGTAPVEAFEGLLDALEMMGATHCEIGHPV